MVDQLYTSQHVFQFSHHVFGMVYPCITEKIAQLYMPCILFHEASYFNQLFIHAARFNKFYGNFKTMKSTKLCLKNQNLRSEERPAALHVVNKRNSSSDWLRRYDQQTERQRLFKCARALRQVVNVCFKFEKTKRTKLSLWAAPKFLPKNV